MEEEKSKSQKKRDADALQKLGVSLVDWSVEKLDKLSLPDNLRRSIIEAKSLKSHGAMRRQAQLIGKLMRTADLEIFYPEYEAILSEGNAQTATFHDAETWRTRLLTEGHNALTAFIDTFHPEDIQKLKQLVKKAVDEQNKGQPPAANRALFRFIRACIQ